MPPIPRLFVIFFSFFFQSDLPTQYHETHSTLKEIKKKGVALEHTKDSKVIYNHYVI